MPPVAPAAHALAHAHATGDGTLDPMLAEALPDDLAMPLYEAMVLARSVDERLALAPCDDAALRPPSARGTEATVLGAAAAMQAEDWVFPAFYAFGAALWRGMPLSVLVRRALGAAGARTPDDLSWRPAHVVGASPLAGRHIAHAVGVAWAARLRKANAIALVYFDVRASSGGDFHAALNFAGVSRAPVVAVCTARASDVARQTASDGVAVKAVAYGLRGVRVDGSDAAAVLRAIREAREHVAADGEGTIVEAIFQEGGADPIERLRRRLESRSLWSDEREERLSIDVRAKVDGAVAEAAPAAPSGDGVFDHVYAELPWHLNEQRTRSAAR